MDMLGSVILPSLCCISIGIISCCSSIADVVDGSFLLLVLLVIVPVDGRLVDLLLLLLLLVVLVLVSAVVVTEDRRVLVACCSSVSVILRWEGWRSHVFGVIAGRMRVVVVAVEGRRPPFLFVADFPTDIDLSISLSDFAK